MPALVGTVVTVKGRMICNAKNLLPYILQGKDNLSDHFISIWIPDIHYLLCMCSRNMTLHIATHTCVCVHSCIGIGSPPRISIRPAALTHVQSGVTFVLSCQAMGTPQPSVTWLRDDQPLPSNQTRIRAFESGRWRLVGFGQQHECRHWIG